MVYKRKAFMTTEVFVDEDTKKEYLITDSSINRYIFGILIVSKIQYTEQELDSDRNENKESEKKIGFSKKEEKK